MLAAPNLVFVPILAALLGVGRPTQVAVVFLYAFFPVTATTAAAIRLADSALVEMARAFGAGGRQLFWKVLVPGSTPMILTGLRIGMVRAVKGMITGEMLVAVSGLGALARIYGSRFDAERALAVLLVIVAVAARRSGNDPGAGASMERPDVHGRPELPATSESWPRPCRLRALLMEMQDLTSRGE